MPTPKSTPKPSKRRLLKPLKILTPPVSTTASTSETPHQPTPSPPHSDQDKDQTDIQNSPDDMSVTSAQSSNRDGTIIIDKCQDYTHISMWMHETFPHHFGTEEVFSLTRYYKLNP